MFCPKGYIPLSEVVRRVPFSLQEEADVQVRKFQDKAAEREGFHIGNEILYWFASTGSDFLEDAIFRSLGGNLYIASPAGFVLRFDPWPLDSSGNDENECSLYTALKKDIVLPASLAYSYELLYPDPKELLNAYKAYQADGGSDGFTAWARKLAGGAGFHILPWWHDRLTYAINLDACHFFREAGLASLPAYDVHARTLEPLLGWALCVDASFIEGAWVAELEKAIRDWRGGIRDAPMPNRKSAASIAQTIVGMFDAGDMRNKAAYRDLVGGAISNRAFLHWPGSSPWINAAGWELRAAGPKSRESPSPAQATSHIF